jgi:hypothetical protein
MMGSAEKCPQCGGTLIVKQPSQAIGWVLIIIGLFLTSVCIGLFLIVFGVVQLSKANEPYWYCINCGYSRGRYVEPGKLAALPDRFDSVNLSDEPYFIFGSGFRNNPAFQEAPAHIKASFEKAFEEYTKGNYPLAEDALEKILYDDPTNKAALWGKLGLLFGKPLDETPVEYPLEILKTISNVTVAEEEKERLEKGVVKALRHYYDFFYQKGRLDEATLKKVLEYVDFLVEKNPYDVTHRKYALDLISGAGYKDSDIWNKYHRYLMENDDEYATRYDESVRIAARNKELFRALFIGAGAVCVQVVVGLIMGFIFLSAVASANADIGAAPPPPPAEVEEGPPTAKVLAAAIEVRESPSDWATTIDAVFEGEEVRVLGRDEASEWYKVETPDGKVGWMEAENWEGPTLEF